MHRFRVSSFVFVLVGLLSCKTVECGPGTVEKEGQCVVAEKKETGSVVVESTSTSKSDNKEEEAKAVEAKQAEAEANKKISDGIQAAVDKKIKSWQAGWTRSNGTFDMKAAKGTITNFEITESQCTALVEINFQFTYGRMIGVQSCSPSDLCNGSFKEGKNKSKIVMILKKIGTEFVYMSHSVQ